MNFEPILIECKLTKLFENNLILEAGSLDNEMEITKQIVEPIKTAVLKLTKSKIKDKTSLQLFLTYLSQQLTNHNSDTYIPKRSEQTKDKIKQLAIDYSEPIKNLIIKFLNRTKKSGRKINYTAVIYLIGRHLDPTKYPVR